MWRRLYRLFAGASAALAAVVCGLWVAGCWSPIEMSLAWNGRNDYAAVGFSRGGVTWRLSVGDFGEGWTAPVFPVVALLLVAMIWPRVRRLDREYDRRKAESLAARFTMRTHHCRRCGYDLRATPARCPECGEVPPAESNSSSSSGSH